MKDWGFCGPTYQGYSKAAAVERCINLFPAKSKKTPMCLINAPGKRLFATLTDQPGRGLYTIDSRLWAVAGDTLFEVLGDGSKVSRGDVVNGGDLASMTSSGSRGNQLMVTSGGFSSILNLTTNVLTPITATAFPTGVKYCDYLDGYFVAVSADRFALSHLLDGTVWDTGTGQRAGAPDAIVGAIVDHEILWLFGNQRTEPWFDSGASSFPFEPVPSAFVDVGLAATFAVAAFGDSIGWLSQDVRGSRSVYRNQGYGQVRISTDGIDAMLNACTSVQDAYAWSYVMLGHLFWVLSIPSQRLTVQYDATEDAWSELGSWRTESGRYEADTTIAHAFCFGKHLCLDRESGQIWELSMDVYADGNRPRRWMRRAPHLSNEKKTVFYGRAELDAEFGVGIESGQGSDPQVFLRYSDDGGFTWGNDLQRTVGAQGLWNTRAAWDCLGSSRNRVFEVWGSDPVKTVINDLYLDANPGIH